jgi:phosphopantetheine adenylyltransferase
MRNHLAHARAILECGTDTADVLLRIENLELLAGRVRGLIVDREAIWTSYCETEIISAEDPNTVFAGSRGTGLSISITAHVISAENPYEQFLGEEENSRRTNILEQYLRSCPEAKDLVRVFGRSTNPNSIWVEECWAVSGLTRSQAVEIGRIFQQRAIFELTEDVIMVISSDESVKNSSPRFTD